MTTLTDIARIYISQRNLSHPAGCQLTIAAQQFDAWAGSQHVETITPARLEKWLTWYSSQPTSKSGKPPSKATIKSKTTALLSLLRSANDLGLNPHFPRRTKTKPTGRKEKPVVASTLPDWAAHYVGSRTIGTATRQRYVNWSDRFDAWASSPPLAGIDAKLVNRWLAVVGTTPVNGKLPAPSTLKAAAYALQTLLVAASRRGLCARPLSGEIDHTTLGKLAIRERAESLIGKATAMVADGKTYDEIGAALRVSPHTVGNWAYKPDTKALWEHGLALAMRKMASVVQAQAGTSIILDNPDEYIARAVACEDWHNKQGETLFPTGSKIDLPTFYETYYKPVRFGADCDTITIRWHHYCLKRWVLLTGNPALDEVTPQTLAFFRDALLKMRKRDGIKRFSPNTVWGYQTFIQCVLDKAGPKGRRQRDAAGLIAEPPWCKPVKKVHMPPRVTSEDELSAIYMATPIMDAPCIVGVKAPAWWRALIVTTFNTGLRKGTLFAIRMAWIDWERRVIRIPPEATKTGQGQVMPINETCFAHLLPIKTDREFLFEWDYSAGRTFYWHWHKLLDAAGIEKKDRFGLHAIRKATATLLWEHAPAAAQFTMGHTTPDTTRQYYVNGGGLVARALAAMPQPAAFLQGGAR